MAAGGSVVCPSCGRLVAAAADRCPHCGRLRPGLWGLTRRLRWLADESALTRLVIVGSAALYLGSLALDLGGIGTGGLFGFLSPSAGSLVALGASGRMPVVDFGRWWTVLSASWLHGSLLHILFNMLWVRQLAPVAAHLFGTGRATLVYLASGVTGFLLTSLVGAVLPGGLFVLRGADLTVGASASIFGLMGALVLYGRRTGSRALGQQVWSWAATMFLLTFFLPGIDNFAHLGGFLGGYGAARLLDPLRQERPEHLLAALAGLALSAAAVAVSLLASVG